MLDPLTIDETAHGRLNTAKPVIVVSAVNLTEMGGLSVLTDCLSELARRADDYTIVALVHKKELVGIPGIHYCEYPKSKRSILDRLHHEYWVFWRLSRRLNPFLWLSLHNTTPRVRAKKRAVYCQNVSNLYDLDWREALMQPRFAVVNRFLDLMYRVNLRHNTVVVVQQEWVRQAFRSRFKLNNVVVAHPVVSEPPIPPSRQERCFPYVFFYPSHPTIHKNFQVVGDAAQQLLQDGITEFEIWLTFSQSDNRYAKQLADRYAHIPQVRLLGRLSREEVFQRYAATDCLLFTSRLETWGLPISEFKPYNRPMIIADAPYAREAVGNHPCTAFFPVNSAIELSRLMKDAMQGAKLFVASKAPSIAPPFAYSWDELFDFLLDSAPTPVIEHPSTSVKGSLVRDVPKGA